MNMQRIELKPGREKRILQGHRWVFSNEISSRFSDFEPGSWVEVASDKGALLGSGYINPNSLITVRLLCRPGEKPTDDFFRDLFARADLFRNRVYPGSKCYRMVYGESDGLPGLTVDRYADTLVVQITTAGMARLQSLVKNLLVELFAPKALVYRHDMKVRLQEGLSLEKRVEFGELSGRCLINVDDIRYLIDPLNGQKTGFYLDQRDNRRALKHWGKEKTVLDLFCYNGGWSLSMASAGAQKVVCVDQSSSALLQAQENARLNGLEDRCEFIQADAFEFLKNAGKEMFDLIIADPPAFAKTKKALPEAKHGYRDLNRRALLALKKGGVLVSCSCSYPLDGATFKKILAQGAQASGCRLRLLEARGQSLDHPVLLAMPETDYLKCYLLQKI